MEKSNKGEAKKAQGCALSSFFASPLKKRAQQVLRRTIKKHNLTALTNILTMLDAATISFTAAYYVQ